MSGNTVSGNRVLGRIDLRGQAPGRMPRLSWRACFPAPNWTWARRPTGAPALRGRQARGGAAVREYTAGSTASRWPARVVPQEALSAALAGLDPDRPGCAHRGSTARQARASRPSARPRRGPRSPPDPPSPSGTCRSAELGVYVPGGLVAYPSSVLMNVIPAQVAGVAEIAVASPPQAEHGGLPHPAILAACALLGITEVHAAGGAQAIAMLGYGDRGRAPPVDVITGPGNVYVAAAKRLLRERVVHRRRGRPDRDRHRGRRRRRRRLHRGRPGRAGRARSAGCLPADQHERSARRPGGRRAGEGGARRPSTPSGSRPRWPGSRPA